MYDNFPAQQGFLFGGGGGGREWRLVPLIVTDTRGLTQLLEITRSEFLDGMD